MRYCPWLPLESLPFQPLGAQQKLPRSASEKCPRPGTRFRNQFEIVRHYPAKKITLIPRRGVARGGGGREGRWPVPLPPASRPASPQGGKEARNKERVGSLS